MITKTEKTKVNLPTLHKVHCDKCGQSTAHKVLASHETDTEYTEFNESEQKTYLIDIVVDVMQIVRCENCGTVSVRALQAVRGMHEQNSEGMWVDPLYETLYRPDKSTRHRLGADQSSNIFE